MARISLSKALKLKNRYKGKISELDVLIKTYNSYLEGATSGIDTKEVLLKREKITDALIRLKSAINKANVNIFSSIEKMSELKVKCALLKSVPSIDGPSASVYSDAKNIYIAQIKKSELDKMVLDLENEIEEMQDKIDNYNAQTLFEVEEDILELVKQ